MADVIDLQGRPMVAPGEPLPVSEKLVEFLTEQLERAKSGQLVGFAGAVFNADHRATFWIAGTVGSFAMIGALDCAKEHLRRIAMED